MSDNLREFRKYGTRVYDAAGNVTALHGKLEVGDSVVWLGRKHGSGSHDAKFEVGQSYPVCFIYPSNGDIELQGSEPQITIRAGEEEYRAQAGIHILDECYGKPSLAGSYFRGWIQRKYQSEPGGGMSYCGQAFSSTCLRPLALRSAIKEAAREHSTAGHAAARNLGE